MALPTGSGASGYRNESHREMAPDAIHDGAPGGLFFSESELPISGTFSNPATLGGFSPNSSNSVRPTSESTNVGSLPPTGLRQ